MSGVIYPINNKEYTAEDVEIFNCTRTNGVYSVLDFDCVLNGSVLTVDKGLAWIKNGDFKGKAIAFKEPVELVLEPADADLDRYDVVAIRYDATKTEPELVVISGENAEEPEMPEVSRETYLYELFLYAILRKAGEKSPDFENIEDLRENEAYCGIMQDSVTSAVAPIYEEVYNSGNLGVGLSEGDTFQANGLESYGHLNIRVRAGSMAANVQAVKTESAAGASGRFSYYGTVANREKIYTINLEIENLGSGQYSVNILKYKTDSTDWNTYCWIVSIEGVSKTPRGYVAVDSIYNPNSDNAQSGKAVAQALENIEVGFDYTLPIGGDELGGVKNGGNVVINEDGTMTAPASGGGGEAGADGKSAYQIALDNGFEGTEEEWLESLNGSDGFSPIARVEQADNGANITITDKNGTTNATVLNGKDGISATHSWNGTVLTVTSASGTSSADLKGDKGDKGDPFTYEDFTAEQLAALKGEPGTVQLTPLFANSTDECTDTTKLYVLPDGFVYAYMYEEITIPGNPLYTNLANPTSENWAVSSRFNSGGVASTVDGMNADISNYIPIVKGSVVRVKGIDLTNKLPNGSNTRSALYANDKTFLSVIDTSATHSSYVTADDEGVSTIIIDDALITALAINYDVKFIRIGGTLTGTKEDVIITVNEEIKNSDPTIEKEYRWTNTGRAFVPADYEGRIVDLENKATNLENRISGIEENGTTSEQVSDVIPEYWESAVSAAIEKIKAKQNLAGHHCVNFIDFADMHIIYGSSNHAHNVGKLSRHIMDKCDIPLTCFLGDWVNSAGEVTKEQTFDDVRVAKEILAPISNEELCTITGNHDLWFDGNTHTVTMEERYNAVCRHNTKDFHKVFGEDGNYYYVDNVPQKTRFIFLDGNWAQWTIDSNNKPDYTAFAQGGYGQAQLQFLADNLRVQSGWSVCVFTHVPPIEEYRGSYSGLGYIRDESVLIGIINAYIDKTAYTGSCEGKDYNGLIRDWAKVNISVDYTSESGEFIAMFTGHRHLDEVFTDEIKRPIVTITTCSGQKLKDGHARTYGTNTETALDVVTINKKARKIYCTRLGVGSDREISY